MISQNSSQTDRGHTFFGQLVWNAKQRVWLLALNCAALLFYFPLQFMAVFSGAADRMAESGDLVTALEARKRFLEAICYGNIIFFGVMVTAVVAAISGFSYLYDRAKVDFYHAQPVGPGERFAFTYLTGLLYFLLPLFLFSGLLFGAGLRFGILDAELVRCGLLLLILLLLYYLAVYHTAILAITLTGNYIAGVCGVLALLGTEWCIRRLTFEYARQYLHTFSENSRETVLSCLFSGANIFLEAGRNIKAAVVLAEFHNNPQLLTLSQATGISMPYMARLTVIGAVTLLAAFLFYRRRDAGSAGIATSYRFVGILAIYTGGSLAGITVGWLIGRITGKEEISIVLFGIVAGAVIAGLVICMILQRRPGDLLRKLWVLILCCITASVFFLCFAKDLPGFDKKVFDKDELAGASVVFDPQLLEIGWYQGDKTLLSQMNIADLDAVIGLAEADYYHREESGEEEDTQEEDDLWVMSPCTVCYKLTNGKNAYRSYYIDYANQGELLDRIMSNQSYKETMFPILTMPDPRQNEAILSLTTADNNYAIEDEDIAGVLAALRRDMESFNYTMQRDGTELGLLHYYEREEGGSGSKDYPIYESFDNVLSFLQEKGYIMTAADLIPDRSQVTSLEVYIESGSYEDPVLYFTEPEEIQSILSCSEMAAFGTDMKDQRRYRQYIAIYAQVGSGNYMFYKLLADEPMPPELSEYE